MHLASLLPLAPPNVPWICNVLDCGTDVTDERSICVCFCEKVMSTANTHHDDGQLVRTSYGVPGTVIETVRLTLRIVVK